MPLIWAYCRVSTTKEDQEESLDAQEAWARTFASEQQADLRLFREQASAKTTVGRPIFQAMMAELVSLQKGKRPMLLAVTALDRLSRSLRDTLNVVEALRELRIQLYQRGLGVIGTDTFPEKAALAGLSLAGEAENYSRSLRAKQSWERRRAQGKPTSNKVPYGLQLQGERDAPIPSSALWVKRAFQWYARGVGMYTIALRFAEAAPPHTWLTSRIGPDGKRIQKTRGGTKWESNRIGKLLKQQRYRGTIVSPELFDRVQDRLSKTPRLGSRRIREYPLSGALRCHTCNRRLHGCASGGAKLYTVASGELRRSRSLRRTRYYACCVCNYRLNADALESSFFQEIRLLAADEALLQRWVGLDKKDFSEDRSTEVKRLERECLPEIYQSRIDRLIDLALKAQLSESQLRRQVERLKAENDVKVKRLEELNRADAAHDAVQRSLDKARRLVKDFHRLFSRTDYETKRVLINDLVEALGGAVTSPSGLSWNKRNPTLRNGTHSRSIGSESNKRRALALKQGRN